MAQTYLSGDFQTFSELWPVIVDTVDFPLDSISANIPVKGIFGAADTLCPKDGQLEFWNKIPNRPSELNHANDHGYIIGNQSAAFLADLYALMAGDDAANVESNYCESFSWF